MMGGNLVFEILGPLRIRSASGDVAVNAGRERTLLAVLLLHANSTVLTEYLVDAIWPDPKTPPSARNQLQGCVHRLRRRFTDAGATGPVIVTEPFGYRADIDPDDLDLNQFRRLVADARTAANAGQLRDAADHYRAALARWRGPALAGVEATPVRDAAAALDEEHNQVLEEHVKIELATGAAGELIPELTDLVQRHPYREGLHQALMLALYRAGRQADALLAYRKVRQLLRDELGTEPGADLQDLHQAILRRDPALETPAAPAPPAHVSSAPSGSPRAPRQLPASVAGFTGRDHALKTLDRLLADGPGAARTVVIGAIAGTAGVGKTALAVHWAYQVADRFPDGQMYVNLHGFAPSGQASTSPMDALRVFLDALEVAPSRIPARLDAQVGLYRSLLANRRMLIVLDDARDAEQVRPLLPGAPGCLVVVTSRNQLTSLVAVEGAQPLLLGVFTTSEARQFLAHRLGPDRVAAEPWAVDDIIAGCAGLPLALAIVAARAATSPQLPLAALAGQLRESRDRLDALHGGDQATDLRTVFSWSYRALSTDAARLFRLLGLHPGPDVTAPAVANLAGVPLPHAQSLLDELVHGHLVTERNPGRYAFHDLLRAYATELAHTVDTDAQRRAALRRTLDHYLRTAYAADRLLNPHRDPLAQPPTGTGETAGTGGTAGTGATGGAPVDLTSYGHALAWFTAEHAVLLAAIEQAVAAGFDAHAWQLAWTLVTFHQRRVHLRAQISAHRAALEATRRLGDHAAQAHTHRTLGRAYAQLGCHEDARSHLGEALELFDKLGDDNGRAHTHRNLAYVCERTRDHGEALRHSQRALLLYQLVGNQAGQARTFNSIGWYQAMLGEHRRALAYCHRALPLLRALGIRHSEAATWDSLGYAHHHLGQHRKAISCYRRAVRVYRDLDDQLYEARTLVSLGDTQHASGDHTAARQTWQRALAILEDLDHPDAEQVRPRLQ